VEPAGTKIDPQTFEVPPAVRSLLLRSNVPFPPLHIAGAVPIGDEPFTAFAGTTCTSEATTLRTVSNVVIVKR
jgi:hypothetical protein